MRRSPATAAAAIGPVTYRYTLWRTDRPTADRAHRIGDFRGGTGQFPSGRGVRRQVVPHRTTSGGSICRSVYVAGRKKELIITATGQNIAPAALEDAVREHWLIDECVLTGDQRP